MTFSVGIIIIQDLGAKQKEKCDLQYMYIIELHVCRTQLYAYSCTRVHVLGFGYIQENFQ